MEEENESKNEKNENEKNGREYLESIIRASSRNLLECYYVKL